MEDIPMESHLGRCGCRVHLPVGAGAESNHELQRAQRRKYRKNPTCSAGNGGKPVDSLPNTSHSMVEENSSKEVFPRDVLPFSTSQVADPREKLLHWTAEAAGSHFPDCRNYFIVFALSKEIQ